MFCASPANPWELLAPIPGIPLREQGLGTITAFRSAHIEASGEKETGVTNVLSHQILVNSNPYDGFVIVPWLNKSPRRRMVAVCETALYR